MEYDKIRNFSYYQRNFCNDNHFFSDLMSIQRYAVSHAIKYGLELNAAKGRRKKLRNAQSRNISGVQLQQLL